MCQVGKVNENIRILLANIYLRDCIGTFVLVHTLSDDAHANGPSHISGHNTCTLMARAFSN